jgi:hypothetical protein
MNLKYYDGMGRDVTDYVTGLEAKIEQLEKQIAPKVAETDTKWLSTNQAVTDSVGVVEEEPKPKPKKKKVTKVADA